MLESLKGAAPQLFPTETARVRSGFTQSAPCHRPSSVGTYSDPVAWETLVLAYPPSLSSLPPYTAGTQTSLKFITLHHTPRRARIHHCAFHGGEGRENVKSFTCERSIAAATGPDGHGRWDLLVPLSWKMNRITCCNQRSTPQVCILLPLQHFLWSLGKALTYIWVCNNSFVKENHEISPSLPGVGKLG